MQAWKESLMNRPIWRGSSCVGYEREVIHPEVAELVLECVHPSNLGPLPPSDTTIAWKAVQIGLISSLGDAFKVVRTGQFN